MGNMFSMKNLTRDTNKRIFMETTGNEDISSYIEDFNELLKKSKELVDYTHHFYTAVLDEDVDKMIDDIDTFYAAIRNEPSSSNSKSYNDLKVIKCIERDKHYIEQFKRELENNNIETLSIFLPDANYKISTQPIVEMINEIKRELSATKEERENIIMQLPEKLTSNYFDRVRGFVVSRHGESISKKEFSEILAYNENILINKPDIIEICDDFIDIRTIINKLEMERTQVTNDLKRLYDEIEKMYKAYVLSDNICVNSLIHFYNRLVQFNELAYITLSALNTKMEYNIDNINKMYDFIISNIDSDKVYFRDYENTLTPSTIAFAHASNTLDDVKIERTQLEYYAITGNNDAAALGYDLKRINENFTSKVKETVNTLIKKIKNIFDKFRESVNKLVLNDKKYLEKYKSIILNKPMRNATYEMYDFPKGIAIMNNATVPAFNYQSLKDDLGSEEEFINKYFSKYKIKDLSFTDSCKLTFRGSDKKINMSSANMSIKDMYEFCINYSKVIDKIKTDMNNIENASKEAISIIDTVSVNTESVVYSTLNETVLYVLKEDDASEFKKSGRSMRGGKQDKLDSSGVKTVETERQADAESRKNNSDNKNSDIDRIMTYMKVVQNFLGSKMNVLQEVYKGYMFIIRDHIKGYTGTRDTSKNNKDADGSNMKNVEESYYYNHGTHLDTFNEAVKNLVNHSSNAFIKQAITLNENFDIFNDETIINWDMSKAYENPMDGMLNGKFYKFIGNLDELIEKHFTGILDVEQQMNHGPNGHLRLKCKHK